MSATLRSRIRILAHILFEKISNPPLLKSSTFLRPLKKGCLDTCKGWYLCWATQIINEIYVVRIRKEFACTDVNQDFSVCLSQLTQTSAYPIRPLIPTLCLFQREKFSSPCLLGPSAYSGPKSRTIEVQQICRQAKFEYLGVDPLASMASPICLLLEWTVLELAKSIKLY